MNGVEISLFDLTTSISEATDLMDLTLSHHQRTVAIGSMAMARALDLPHGQMADLYVAASLHDIGALRSDERQALAAFELDAVSNRHAELGYRLLNCFPPFQNAAHIVKYHHTKWEDVLADTSLPECARLESQIIHLVDRVAILMEDRVRILAQAPEILARVNAEKGTWFNPELVELLERLSRKEVFWLDLASPFDDRWLRFHRLLPSLRLDLEAMQHLGQMLAHLIDFRSPFTATHSAGVGAVAECLAEAAGFSEHECRLFGLAGLLHDLGKLAVPGEILQKASGLTAYEANIIRSHTYYTHRILARIPGLQFLSDWAANHHERPGGGGYPFAYTSQELSMGARLMAVADVFTAVTEDRPYRVGMDEEQAQRTLLSMAANEVLDRRLTDLAIREFVELNRIRSDAQRQADCDYKTFFTGLDNR